MKPGTLFIVATPIGNLGDITLRALDTLRSVDRIAAEDTRHTRKLLTHFDIHKPLASYHSRNADRRGPELLQRIQGGEDIALVTDAGTPGISDPGALLVRQAVEKGIKVSAIPGPSAFIMALVASGLPTHPFAFLGFPPARGAGRRRFFSSYADLPMTLILYESPQRLRRTLDDLLHAWGNRRIVVARELTKKFEEVFRGSVTDAQLHYADEIKGEITLVVAGSGLEGGEERKVDECEWPDELKQLIHHSGVSVKAAADKIARRYGLPRRTVYQKALRLKSGLNDGD